VERCRDPRVSNQEETDTQPRETDQNRVQVMTLHASKGLEYPVVFLAGGFTQGKLSAPFQYRENDQTVFDLVGTEDAKRKAGQEQENQNRRLYYVALTRARFKLYVP